MKKRLPVRIELDKRGIDLHSSRCPLCDEDLETTDHTMIFCSYTRDIWNRVFQWWGLGSFLNYDFNEILGGNSGVSTSSFGKKIWQAVEWISAYYIWKNRNNRIFRGTSWCAPVTLSEIQVKSFEWISLRSKGEKFDWLTWLSSPHINKIALAFQKKTIDRKGIKMKNVEEKFKIVRSIGEECIQEEELLDLLKNNKPQPICYDALEPSGRMHIAEGIMKIIHVNKLTSLGIKVKIWIADICAILNNKLGGDMKIIETVGRYMIEIWKASGMNLDNVEFIWSSEEISSRSDEYWNLVLDIARRNTLRRIKMCCPDMDDKNDDKKDVAQIFYRCMQCADIIFLKADICQFGMDQLEVNVLAREYCDDIERKNKPVILSHHMLPDLLQGQEKKKKMSTSDSSSAIFMEDEEAEVNLKIKKAYCPPNIVQGNPCLEYIKHIIFPWFNEFKVERKAENGGEKVFTSFEKLVAAYEKGDLHPADLKPSLSKALNTILQPVHDHFKNDVSAKDLLKRVKAFKVKEKEKEKERQRENSMVKKGESVSLTSSGESSTSSPSTTE
ncbi:tyrosine--tRNA ligase 1, cytoplasmic-like [Rutidosis leptorrhynchoides]|uniref:tyrosine--tRNA ligase 1, cytoplasmic-like n=1 Tax=Rutidosis leptorrhynchoides TaxID=125765 RepID=UPI003A99CBBE